MLSVYWWNSLKKGWFIADFNVILFDGSNYIIYVRRSIASISFSKFELNYTKFSFPFTFHLGKEIFISGINSDPYHDWSLGVPRTLNILKIYPISLSP